MDSSKHPDNEILNTTLTSASLQRGRDKIAMVLVYADDLLLIENDHSMIQHTKEVLHTTFRIKDLGELKYFLGIEFARRKVVILMYQRNYVLELVADMELAGAKPVPIPMDQNQRLTTAEFD